MYVCVHTEDLHNPRKLLNTEAPPGNFNCDGNMTGLNLHLEIFHFFYFACLYAVPTPTVW